MPFRSRDRKGWRGQVKWQGKTYRADFPTRREAVEWEAKRREELKQPQTPARTVMDFETFANRYLDHVQLRFVQHTYEKKRRICKKFLAYTGNLSVDEITPKLVQEYLDHQARIRSTDAHNEDYCHLRAMWSWGMDILDLQSNPFAKMRRLPHERAAQYTPSTQDVLRVLSVATREERVFLNAYLQTGARKSEIFRWTWVEDINFERREVRLGTKKTRDGSMSYEWLPMNDELYNDLLWWYKNRPIRDTPYVFASTRPPNYGKPYTERAKFLKKLCERARVREFGYHALRRYVASVLADTHKVSSKTIQRILRHKKLATTERYVKSINQDLGEVMNLLGEKGYQGGLPKDGNQVENGQ